MGLYEILKASKLGAGAAPDMYTALLAQKINKGSSGGEAELSGVPPLTFTADGTPLIDYLISGNTTQSGTPTPDNPVMPQGCGNKTANLLDSSTVQNGYTLDSATGLPVVSPQRIATTTAISIPQGTTTIKVTYSPNNITFVYATFRNGTLIDRVTSQLSGSVLSLDNIDKIYISWYKSGTTITTNDVTNIMVNTGSTALPYEPFGVKIPISSANTTTPVYLGEVQTTRKIKKIKASDITWIDGSTTGYNFYRGNLTISKLAGDGISTLLSNKYRSVETRNNLSDGDIASYNITTIETIVIRDDRYSSAADWLSANGDTEIWYVLATEETGIVNEPLMRIGDYADTLSYAQAGVTIPTNNGSTTVDVDTTVKPSEVYIKYRT